MGDKIPLTKRQYLGQGCVHIFTNDKTGELAVVPTSQEEYDSLALANPSNPTLEGHTWVQSQCGTKVDSPTTLLGENEYCEIGGKYEVVVKDTKGEYKLHKLEKKHIVNDELSKTVIEAI